MKKITLSLFLFLLPFFVKAQDPDIYGAWELHRMEFHWGGPLLISDIEPPISPWLIINENNEFEGFGACNSFSGELIDLTLSRYRAVNYTATTHDCETQYLDAVEDEMFKYFYSDDLLYYELNTEPNGLRSLWIYGLVAFDWHVYVETTLSTDDNMKVAFKVYPNPVSDVLFISSESATAQNMAIYNVVGQMVLEQAGDVSQVDVSMLNQGIYFLEITSEEGRSVQKFIKR